MIGKEKRSIYKIISVFMAVALLVGVIPTGLSGYAQESDKAYFSVQVISNGTVSADAEGIECSFSNTDGVLSYSGVTDANGVWQSEYLIGEEYEGDNEFTFVVSGTEMSQTVDMTTVQPVLIYDSVTGVFEWADEFVKAVKLESVGALSDVEDVANATEKSAASLGLPSTVTIETLPETDAVAKINWDIENCSYDPSVKTEQTFDVTGTVVLPEGVLNTDDISLNVTVSVTVLAADDSVFTNQPEDAELKVGDTLELTAQASGADEDSYQWYKVVNGVETQLSNGKGQTFTIDGVKVDDAGEYLCKVTGENGNVISSDVAVVSVTRYATNVSVSTNPTSPQARPITSIELLAEGVEDDYIGGIEYYVNGVRETFTSSTTYVFTPLDDVDKYTFKVRLTGDDKYEPSESEEITFEINKGTQSALTFVEMLPSESVFGDFDGGFYARVEGGDGTGEIKYEIIDEKYPDGTDGYKVAWIDTSGKITIYKAGSFVVTAYKKGDDNYNDSEVVKSEVITVNRAEQSGFEFENSEVNFVYNTGDNTVTLIAQGGKGDGEVVYSVPEDNGVLEVVDANAGVFRVLKVGTVTVTATKAEDACYLSTSADCVLTVEKAEQAIAFEKVPENGSSFSVAYGEEFANKAVEVKNEESADSLGYGSGKIVYYVKDGSSVVSSVDENGKLLINDSNGGTVIIGAYKEECENYKVSPEITYIVEIHTEKYDDKYYSDIDGDKLVAGGEWYTSDITIYSVDGYLLGTKKNSLLYQDWNETITISTEGSNNGLDVYMRRVGSLGAQYGIVKVPYHIPGELLKIDKTKPSDIKISYENENWYDDVLDAILFGNHENTLKFTVEAKDEHSGVDRIDWTFTADITDNEAYSELGGSASGDELSVNGAVSSATFSIEFTEVEQVRGNISVKVTDVAGWESELKDEKKIIFDTAKPDVNLTYTSGEFVKFIDLTTNKTVLEEGENTARVYYGDTAVQLSVSDITFTETKTIVKVNGEIVDCDWDKNADVYTTELRSDVDGVYRIELETTDTLGETASVNTTVIIDNTLAQIRSEFISEVPAVSEGIYNDKIKLRLYVSEENFNAENVKVEFTANDISGKSVVLDTDYNAYFSNEANWFTDGSEYYAEAEISKEAIYAVDVVYSDASGDVEYATPGFVLDTSIPFDVSISYDESSLRNKIGDAIRNITSNYFSPDVDVIVKASDNISGIAEIKLAYTKSETAPEGSAESFELIAGEEDFTYSEDMLTATAEFRIPADAAENLQLSGYFKAVAVDNAENSSEEVADSENLIIVDSIAPECTVNYSTPNRIVDGEMLDVETIESGVTAKLYYEKFAELVFEITEANFAAEDIEILVTKNGNEVVTVAPEEWTKSGNKYTGHITLEGEGNYVVSVEYTDRSDNEMASYESYEIIVDDTVPVISAEIIPSENTQVTDTVSYNGTVTLELTVVDANFRASDITFDMLTAKDINGNEVQLDNLGMGLEDIKAYFADEANWSASQENENTYTASIELVDDAVYAASVSYTDLACHKTEENANANAIVDTTAPSEIEFVYSESKFAALINDITFGYYNPDVTVTVSAKDVVTGVESIVWSYNRADDASESNVETLSGIVDKITQDETDKSLFSGSFTLPLEDAQQLDGHITVTASDKVGNGAESTDDDSRIIVDTISPEMSVDYLDVKNEIKPDASDENSDQKSKLYFKDSATIVFTVTDINFKPEDINSTDELYAALGCKMLVSKDGTQAQAIVPEQWTAVEGKADTYTGSITLSGDGVYVVTVEYKDRSLNSMETYVSHNIIVDSTAPVVSAEIVANEGVNNNDGIYNGTVKLVMTVVEKNFRAEDFSMDLLTAKDINGNEVSLISVSKTVEEIKQYFTKAENWSAVDGKEDTYTASFTFIDDAVYEAEASYTDLSTIKSEKSATANATVDTVVASEDEIDFSYSKSIFAEIINNITNGYYNPDVTVTVTAKDNTSGVAKIDWTYNRADDASQSNTAALSGTAQNLVQDSTDKSVFTANFTLPLEDAQQLDGHVTASVTDKAGNNSDETDTANRIIVDKISPKMSVGMTYEQAITDTPLYYPAYTGDKVNKDTLLFSKNSDSSSITFIVEEINFIESDVNEAIVVYKNGEATTVKPEWTKTGTDTYTGVVKFTEEGDYQVKVSYADRSGNVMEEYISPVFVVDMTAPEFILTASTGSDYYSQAKMATIAVNERAFRAEEFSFTFLNESDEPDGSEASVAADEKIKKADQWKYDEKTGRYFIVFEFGTQGTYKFRVTGCDVAGNQNDEGVATEFVIDTTAPEDLSISYEYAKLDKLIDVITFGYYNPEVKVNLTAFDELSGVYKFDWKYTVENGVSDVNISSESGTVTELTYTNENRTATGSFILSAEAAQQQYRGNISFTATDRVGNVSEMLNDTDDIVVVDTISPTRQVEFSEAKQVVHNDTLATVENYNYSSEQDAMKLIYDGAATATLRINEANFYPEDVVITVNDNPASVDRWENSGDDWTGNLTFTEDGHYIVKISYTDRSTNQMVEYISNEVIVDTVAPVIKVTYSPDNVVNTKENNNYYGERQTATITVTEHNFRASDIVAVITAKDISGGDISVDDFASYLKNPSNWTSNGDVHTATITYSADANYTFDIDYTDLSLRPAEDYEPDSFTVDTTPPENLTISYSTSVLDTVINAATFNFYDAPVTVTVSADDDVSGVGEFVYNYENSFGGAAEQSISESAISYSNGGATGTADFVIPEQALTAGNQFNGTVDFYAVDRSYNQSEKFEDQTVLVVDNIAPQATITFNEPVTSNDAGAYYAGDVTATIVVEEDNFYAEDVHVFVNGEAYTVSNWSSNGNVHTGTVVIAADGDYIVTVDYKDRSDNTMNSYESHRLTIDREAPKVYVSGIKNESASNAETISFTIRAEDTNFNPNEFKPELTATVLNDAGKFETRTIAIGSVQTVESGKVYSITTGNIELDGVYTLTCSATDMSGNNTTDITVVDSGNANVPQVRFSVNRNGSTFILDEYTRKAVDSYYVGKVEQNIVIEEINVGQLDEYKVELNGKVLTEGEDYTVVRAGGDWNKYTYSVKAALFDAEGVYSLVVTSVDGTQTTAYSDLKNAEINFVVDKTAPVITVSGAKQNGRYQTDKQTVTIIPADDGGKLYSLKVVITDEDGNVTAVPYELSGDELLEAIEAGGGMLTFEIGEGVYQNVDIICTDEAGNEYVSGEVFHNITVSPSGWVILWANPVFRIGLFSGLGAVALGIFFLIFLKKKKKDENQK